VLPDFKKLYSQISQKIKPKVAKIGKNLWPKIAKAENEQ